MILGSKDMVFTKETYHGLEISYCHKGMVLCKAVLQLSEEGESLKSTYHWLMSVLGPPLTGLQGHCLMTDWWMSVRKRQMLNDREERLSTEFWEGKQTQLTKKKVLKDERLETYAITPMHWESFSGIWSCRCVAMRGQHKLRLYSTAHTGSSPLPRHFLDLAKRVLDSSTFTSICIFVCVCVYVFQSIYCQHMAYTFFPFHFVHLCMCTIDTKKTHL